MSKKDVEFLLPNLANDGIKGEADKEVDEQAGVDLKETMLGEREAARKQEVNQVAQEDG